MKIYDVIVIGGGAAGLFLAANLRGLSVAILEQNSFVGKKIMVSGGGRCNITNRFISSKNYVGDEEFVSEILSGLTYKNVLDFFGELEFSEQKANQFFCNSGSRAVLNVLLKKVKQNKAEIFTNTKVVDLQNCDLHANEISCENNHQNLTTNNLNKDDKNFKIFTQNGLEFYAKNVVIATGGLSYKALGVSSLGYELAIKFGLDVITPTPALVGWSVQKNEFWFKNLSGISVRAKVLLGRQNFIFNDKLDALDQKLTKQSDKSNNKDQNLQSNITNSTSKIKKLICGQNFITNIKSSESNSISIISAPYTIKFVSDILFTHRGISGPAILNASLFWQKGQVCIDFLPNFSFETIAKSKKQLSTILPLPRRFVLEYLSNFNLIDQPFCNYKNSDLKQVLKLKNYHFAPAGNFGFDKAEVSRGGVSTSWLDKSCAIKKLRFSKTEKMDKNFKDTSGLYFVGEVLNVAGMLGGYNLHFAFASALAAAKELNKQSNLV